MLCTLCPIWVTAINFLDLETAMFKGKSPSGNERPAGDNFHPFGRTTTRGSSIEAGCAKLCSPETRIAIIREVRFISISGYTHFKLLIYSANSQLPVPLYLHREELPFQG